MGTWMSEGAEGETLFLTDKISHMEEGGLQSSLSRESREPSRLGLSLGEDPPPLLL